MIIECLDIRDSIETIHNLNLSKIDKLFLIVLTINQTHFRISRKELSIFERLNTSKIIFVQSYSMKSDKSYQKLTSQYVAFNAWKGEIILLNHSYQYQNYNFIAFRSISKCLVQFQADKINIGLVRPNELKWDLNDHIRLAGGEIFIDILIEAKRYDFNRILKISLGATYVMENVQKYIRAGINIIDDKVYLKF